MAAPAAGFAASGAGAVLARRANVQPLRGGATRQAAATAAPTTMAETGGKPVLYDMPVSNNGARCRVIIYKKLIEDQVTIASPMDIGGLKSPEYLALNPQGKMPLLVTDEITLPESDTICRYLLDRFSGSSPSFVPSTVAARARSDLLCRLHDMYVTTIQGALYKATPPFGIFGSRLEALAELRKQLIVLNNAADETGPYLAGEELSLADATVFPTMVFVAHMLPLFSADGAALDIKGVMGERLGQWYLDMQANDAVFKRVHQEIQSALDGWSSNGRWNTILHAGLRDTDASTIFDKIVAKEIPSTVVFEDDKVLMFKDINPQAPTHLLVIPKQRQGLTQLRKAQPDHASLLGHMLTCIAKVAKEQELGDYRVVVNDGANAGQEVFHLHMHVLAGRAMTWPPG